MPPVSALKPVCLLCLDPISGFGGLENLVEDEARKLATWQFKEFLQFSREYLSVEQLENVVEVEVLKKPVFCGGCYKEVRKVLEGWRKLQQVRLRLLGRLKLLRDRVQAGKEGKDLQRTKTAWRVLCQQLGGKGGRMTWEEVQRFQMEMVKSCDKNASEILPNLILRRAATKRINPKKRGVAGPKSKKKPLQLLMEELLPPSPPSPVASRINDYNFSDVEGNDTGNSPELPTQISAKKRQKCRKRCPSPASSECWEPSSPISSGISEDDGHCSDSSPESPVLPLIKLESLAQPEELQKTHPSQKEIAFWSVFIIYSMQEDLDLPVIIRKLFYPDFIYVGRATTGVWKVPSRETLVIFCHLILIFSYAYDWNLESEILKHYELPSSAPPVNNIEERKILKTEASLGDQRRNGITRVVRKRRKPGGWSRRKPGPRNGSKRRLLSSPTKTIDSSSETTVPKKRGPGRPVGWRKKTVEATSTSLISAAITLPEFNEDGKWNFRKRSANQLEKMKETQNQNEDGEADQDPDFDMGKDRTELEEKSELPPVSFPTKRKKREAKCSAPKPKIKSRNKPFLPNHFDSHGFALKCPQAGCATSYISGLNYDDHQRRKHKTVAIPQCTVCNSQDNCSWKMLKSHHKLNHETSGNKTHPCCYCDQAFTNPQMLALHQRDHHWILPHHLFCQVEHCCEKFQSVEELHQHLTGDHSLNSEEIFTCDQCKWPFPTHYWLHLHKFVHLQKVDNHYHCEFCLEPLKFKSPYCLSFHFNKEHGGANKVELYQCPKKCWLWFSSETSLEAHLSIHQICVKREFLTYNKGKLGSRDYSQPKPRLESSTVCIYCGKKFSGEFKERRSARNQHELTCPEGPSPERRLKQSKKFGCNQCDYELEERCHMIRHLMSHRKPSNPCPYCGKLFQRPDHLNVHIKRKHNSDGSAIVCHLCGTTRGTESELRYHLSTHENTHECQECGKRFSRAWLLRVHMRSHTGVRLQCEYCPELFREVPKLKKHLKEKHPLEYEKQYEGKVRVKYRMVTKEQLEVEEKNKLDLESLLLPAKDCEGNSEEVLNGLKDIGGNQELVNGSDMRMDVNEEVNNWMPLQQDPLA